MLAILNLTEVVPLVLWHLFSSSVFITNGHGYVAYDHGVVANDSRVHM